MSKQSLEEGYNKFVVRNPEGCWGWKGCKPANPGYGQFRTCMRLERAHRASWMIHYGEIPKGMFVLHKCDNTECSNPEHLFLGNHQDNFRDMLSKGRHKFFGASGERNHKAVLTPEKVKYIRSSSLSSYKLAKELKVSPYTVWEARTGKTWKGIQ